MIARLIVFTLALSFLPAVTLAAKTSTELEKKYRSEKVQLLAMEAEKRKVLASLYSINQKMKKIAQEKGKAVDRMLEADNKAKQTAEKISELESELAIEKKSLRARLRALYRISGEGHLAMIFSQKSGHDLDQTLKYLKLITARDYELIKAYQAKLVALDAEKSKLKTTVQKYLAVQKEIKGNEQQLLSEHKAKMRLVTDLEKRYANQLSALKVLKPAEESATDRELLSFLKPSFFEKKGELEAPVQGPVVQGFGVVTHERFKTQLSHKGWQLSAEEGSEVRAVFEGKVAHLGWEPGYGYVVIVDHGDNYYTVYAHTKNSKLKVGDEVKRGDVIAYAASSSKQYGSGIYFEIRHFSEPENPKHWVKSQNIRISAHQGASSL